MVKIWALWELFEDFVEPYYVIAISLRERRQSYGRLGSPKLAKKDLYFYQHERRSWLNSFALKSYSSTHRSESPLHHSPLCHTFGILSHVGVRSIRVPGCHKLLKIVSLSRHTLTNKNTKVVKSISAGQLVHWLTNQSPTSDHHPKKTAAHVVVRILRTTKPDHHHHLHQKRMTSRRGSRPKMTTFL